MAVEELIGRVFTRLTVLGHDGTRGKNSYLKCQCSCGVVKSIRRDALLKGDVQSCGCLGRELNAAAFAAAEPRREARQTRKKLIGELNEVFFQGKDMAKCEHGRERTVCRECGGGSFCEHERIRATCSVCSPEKVYAAYKHKAIKERNLSFSLTLQEFEKLVAEPCFYCGENYEPRGLDRRDNRIGYNSRNVVSACKECNFMKLRMLEHRFIRRAQLIVVHQEKLRKQKITMPVNENLGAEVTLVA